MPAAWTYGLELLAVITGSWILDVAIRRDAPGKLLARLGVDHPAAVPALWVAVTAVLAATLRWSQIADSAVVLPLACGLSLMLAWRATTTDLDPVFPDRRRRARVGLAAAAVAVYWTPAPLILVLHLLTRPFDAWRYHALMPMRGLVATTAFVLLGAPWTAVFGGSLDVGVLVAFVLLIHASCYFTAGVSKTWLGPRWYSWARDNRMHHLAASSYSWGWARWVPWPLWLRVIRRVQRHERPLQVATFLAEVAAPLALLSPTLALAFCAVWSLFHVGVVALTGIFFWEWIAANAALALALWLLPGSLAGPVFGWHAVAVGYLVIFLGPMRGRLWEPTYLSWWDSPFTQRIHWVVEGESGAKYGLYTRMMGPSSRLYSMAYGSFLAPASLITYKIGAVFRRDLRDAIVAAGPDLAQLAALRARFGVQPRDPRLAANHLTYIRRFLRAVNRGAPRSSLPRPLRWLKAPVDHYYDWGDLPAFRGQEPAVRCVVRYREEFFDGARLVRLRDEAVAEVTVDAEADRLVCTPEPTAREQEHFLLRALWQASEPTAGASADPTAAYR